jgi:hypothetical protein
LIFNSSWNLPETEEYFLYYSSKVILYSCRYSPVFEKKIYERGLGSARDDEFKTKQIRVDFSWKQNASMTPLFAASQEMVLISQFFFVFF